MPELPEVETVARDLRPRILGATIVGARTLVGANAADAHAGGVRRGVAGRRIEARRAAGQAGRHRAVGGDAALTIHLKMTGQLFVVPAERSGRSVRAARPRARRRPRAPVPRHPQVRADRAVRARPVTGELVEESAVRSLRRDRPGAARSRVHARASSGDGSAAAEGPAQAAARRPVVRGRASATSTPTRRCGRRGSTRCGPRRRSGRPTSAGSTTRSADPRRGHRAARHLDRRLHGARRRRRDAGAPPGLPADGRAVPALRPADPADRHRQPGDPLLLVVPAAAGRATGGRRDDPADDDRARRGAAGAGPSWPARARWVSPRRSPRARPRGPEPSGLGGPRRRDGRPRGPRRAAGAAVRQRAADRPMSILRLSGVPREIGTFVILDRSTRRSRSATGSGSSGRTAPARRRCSASRPAATSRTAARSTGSAALTLGLLAQEAHFDEAFMASPDLRTAVRHGAAHLDRMAERAGRDGAATVA